MKCSKTNSQLDGTVNGLKSWVAFKTSGLGHITFLGGLLAPSGHKIHP